MTAEIVQANFEQLNSISQRLNRQAQMVGQLVQTIRQTYQPLRDGGWKGQAADSFFNEMEASVFPTFQRLITVFDTAQTVTNDISKTFKSAEEEAASLFKGQLVAQMASTSAAGSGGGLSGMLSVAAGVSGFLGNLMKGIAADALLPQRYILKALVPDLARGKTTVAALMDMMAGKNGRGLPLIRFDGPHKGSMFPHINLEKTLTGFPDPHMPISPRLLNLAGGGAKLLNGLQKVAMPIAIVSDVFRLGEAFHSDGNQIGTNTKQTVGSVAGGWAGGFAGAKAGAVGGAWVGGAIGSIFPGVGTAVGAGVGGFIGGIAGGIGGAFGGSWVGEKLGGLF